MADLPAGPTYGKIVYRALIARGDGTDAGTLPDAVPASGTVTFTPSADSFVIAGSVPPVTVFPETITCTFNTSGDLIDPQGQVGVWLIATDSPATNPTGFTYKVKVAIDGVAKPKVFDIVVPGGVTRDLSVVGPVGVNNGVLITKGDPGPKGDSGPKGDKGDSGASTWDSVTGKPTTFPTSIVDLPPGSTITVSKDLTTGFWPASYSSSGAPVYTGGSATAGVRPTNRADIVVVWRGAGASPAIVTSGTGGMRSDIDERKLIP